MTHLKVMVRIRPFSLREIAGEYKSVVSIEDNNLIAVTNLKVPINSSGDSRERIRRFAFDCCFSSEIHQDEIFEEICVDIKEAIAKSYHSSILAYGQSFSGKTYTMMGNADNPGIIPRICESIFQYIKEIRSDLPTAKVTISYLEIYNEKVRDLLADDQISLKRFPSRNSILKVREHPKKGPYVQGLTEQLVSDCESLLRYLFIGNRNRTVAATLTNPHSSRSHSVFTITFLEGVQLRLVDLAGSERAGSRSPSIATFKEGANINKSLVALGNVILKLAEPNFKKVRRRFIPYRNSVLTWLLKDALGGNSKTVMIATISPSNACYTETINTLRFGQKAKQIVSNPITNEDPKERTIRELRAEVTRLQQLLRNVHIDIPVVRGERHPPFPCERNQDVLDCAAKPSRALTQKVLTTVNASKSMCVLNAETLLPVIEVVSAVKPRQIPPLSITCTPFKMQGRSTKLYSSQEVIAVTKRDAPMRKQSLGGRMPSRKLIGETLPPKRILETRDTGIGTEQSGISDLVERKTSKPRSQIISAVTNRLYAKVHRKDVAVETDAKEFAVASRARMRLRELSHRALKAYRQRHVETQTTDFPVLRIKEVATDMQDFNWETLQVLDAETATVPASTKETGVDSVLLDSFSDPHSSSLTLTRSCSTQMDPHATSPTRKNFPILSFTKYLTYPKLLSNAYTSVNINVSHSYVKDDVDADSLEENESGVYFPTPDIISNHNSLEPSVAVGSLETMAKYAAAIVTYEKLFSIREMDDLELRGCYATVEKTGNVLAMAECQLIATMCAEKVLNRDMFERCSLFWDDRMQPLHLTPKYQIIRASSTLVHAPFVLELANYQRRLHSVGTQTQRRKPAKRRKDPEFSHTLSRFVHEATTLLSTLNGFHVQVTVNEQKTNDDRSYLNSFTQTLPRACHDDYPINSFKSGLEASCNRLEKTIVAAEKQKSLEVDLPYVDRRRESRLHCLPSVYLKQLTNMRRQVVEASKELG